MKHISWDYWCAFLAVIETGSVSAASAQTGWSQPTVSRQIQRLEKALQLQLFQRTARGLIPTAAAEPMVESARAMQKAAQHMELRAKGLQSVLTGSLRISANEVVGTYLLPSLLARFGERYPEVQIELVISNRLSSLSQREADIALRMVEPTQPDLVRRRLASLPLGFFAHRNYVSRYGEPHDLDSLLQHRLIGFEESLFYQASSKALGIPLDPKQFHFRTDHMLAQLALARAGAGIVVTHVDLAQHWQDMQQVLPGAPLPALPFFLLCHQDTRYNALIRVMSDFLGASLQEDPYGDFRDV